MLTLCSFLQSVFTFVKSLVLRVTKKDYRRKAVMVLAGCVVAAVSLTSSGFGGGGKNVLTAFAETSSRSPEAEEDSEEIETITEANVQIALSDSRQEGQKTAEQQAAGQLPEEKIHGKEETVPTEAETNPTIIDSRIRESKGPGDVQEGAQNTDGEAEAQEEEADARKFTNYNEEDYQVLLKIVQAEAGICDAKGKILVANVVLNRVRSGEFPNTIRGVVYQRGQFSPIRDGSFSNCKVTDETVECVNRALAGEDYSQGALYFMNRRTARSRAARWFDSRLTFLFQYENHEFFK